MLFFFFEAGCFSKLTSVYELKSGCLYPSVGAQKIPTLKLVEAA